MGRGAGHYDPDTGLVRVGNVLTITLNTPPYAPAKRITGRVKDIEKDQGAKVHLDCDSEGDDVCLTLKPEYKSEGVVGLVERDNGDGSLRHVGNATHVKVEIPWETER
jgi:hypothetical protein